MCSASWFLLFLTFQLSLFFSFLYYLSVHLAFISVEFLRPSLLSPFARSLISMPLMLYILFMSPLSLHKTFPFHVALSPLAILLFILFFFSVCFLLILCSSKLWNLVINHSFSYSFPSSQSFFQLSHFSSVFISSHCYPIPLSFIQHFTTNTFAACTYPSPPPLA